MKDQENDKVELYSKEQVDKMIKDIAFNLAGMNLISDWKRIEKDIYKYIPPSYLTIHPKETAREVLERNYKNYDKRIAYPENVLKAMTEFSLSNQVNGEAIENIYEINFRGRIKLTCRIKVSGGNMEVVRAVTRYGHAMPLDEIKVELYKTEQSK